MSTMARLGAGLRGLAAEVAAGLMPPVCCLCGFPGARPAFDLCADCGGCLPRVEGTGYDGLGVFRRVIVPFRYEHPVDRFVRDLKFKGEPHYARLLGQLLADAVECAGGPRPRAIIPVPLHSSRYRTRGFNQSQEIARFAAHRLGIPLNAGSLVRNLATVEQSGLSLEARRQNVRGAFRLARAIEPMRVALVDDVLTTGNTVREAARPLIDAGVEDIELWAVARVVLD